MTAYLLELIQSYQSRACWAYAYVALDRKTRETPYDYEAWTYPGEYGRFGGVAIGGKML